MPDETDRPQPECPQCANMRERFKAFVQSKAQAERYLCDDTGARWSERAAQDNAAHWHAESEQWQQLALVLYLVALDAGKRKM